MSGHQAGGHQAGGHQAGGVAEGSRAALRRTRRAVALALACATALACSLAAAGPRGLVIGADCTGGLALLAILGRTPAGDRPGQAALSGMLNRLRRMQLPGRQRRAPAVQASDFPAYQRIQSDLGWAPVSAWHYDHGVRPLLTRLLQAVLAEHQHTGSAADPGQYRHLIGDSLWPLVDPSRPPSVDSRRPGVDLRTLDRLVDRLERL